MSNKRGLSVDFPIALCTATFLAEKVWNIEFELKAAGEGSALYEPLQYFTNGKDQFTDTQMRKQRRHLANKTDHILINISLEIGITYPLTSILPISGHALSLSWNLYNPYTLIQSYSLLKTTLEFRMIDKQPYVTTSTKNDEPSVNFQFKSGAFLWSSNPIYNRRHHPWGTLDVIIRCILAAESPHTCERNGTWPLQMSQRKM